MDENRKPSGAPLFYVGAFVTTLVSIDTSWRFFGERLHITYIPERIAMFAVIEIILIACGVAMRGSVRRDGTPGPARWLAWALCGAAAFMAIELAGPVVGVARAVLGPVLAVICLHLALGIEVKARMGQRIGTMARVVRELRERALSRLGLADDHRDALARTRDRAAERAARLATNPERVWFRRARLARAVRAAGVAVDPRMKSTMLAHAAAYGNLGLLMNIQLDNPWTTPVPSVPSVRPSRPAMAPTSGGPAVGWDVAKVVDMIRRGEERDAIRDATGVSIKNLQRVTRVVRAIQGGRPDEEIVKGDVTAKLVASVQRAMEQK